MERAQVLALLQYGQTSIPKLLLDYYAALGLSEADMMLLLHIHRFIEDDHPFPTPHELSERMSLSEGECSARLRSLIKEDYLKMEHNQDEGVMYETYSLTPLYDRIIQLVYKDSTSNETHEEEGKLYEIFEEEFSRPLSPMECETIKVWLDQDKYKPDLIKAALYETVMSGKLNLRYMDRILHEWHKNGIRTSEEAKAYGEKFRRQKKKISSAPGKEKLPKYPNINWLDES